MCLLFLISIYDRVTLIAIVYTRTIMKLARDIFLLRFYNKLNN